MVLQVILTILFCLFLIGTPLIQWLSYRSFTRVAHKLIKLLEERQT